MVVITRRSGETKDSMFRKFSRLFMDENIVDELRKKVLSKTLNQKKRRCKGSYEGARTTKKRTYGFFKRREKNMIQIITSSRYKINRKRITQFVMSLLASAGVGSDLHLELCFCGKNEDEINRAPLQKEDVALPVLSFSYKDEPIHDDRLLGEVFLCYPQVVLLAAERNKKVEDMIDAMIKHGIENLLK